MLRSSYGSGHLYTFDSNTLCFVIDDLTRQRNGIRAWIEVHATIPTEEDGEPIVFGSFDLTGARTSSTIKGQWREAMGFDLPDKIVKSVIWDAIQIIKSGPGDAIRLEPKTRNDGDMWLLEPLWGNVGATRLIAAGGSGKSFLALAAAIEVSTGRNTILKGKTPRSVGPVLYLDWEADHQTHEQRLSQLLKGAGQAAKGVHIHYVDMKKHGALYRNVKPIQRIAQTHDAGAIIVDSVMLARGSTGDGPAEESTIRLYEAIDEIGLKTFLIDHKNAQQAAGGKKGGYGSVVMDNSARNVWDMIRTRQIPDNGDGPGIYQELEHTKANNTKRYPKQALELRFGGPTVTFQPVGVQSDFGISADTLADQIERALEQTGASTITQLAEHLNKTPASIRNQLNRHDDRFIVVAKSGSTNIWGTPDMDVNQALTSEGDTNVTPIRPDIDGLPEPF